MKNKREKKHREADSMEESNKKTSQKDQGKDDKYSEENNYTTDSDAAEISPRMRQASERSGNDIEEGDEDYDDEDEDKII